MKKFFGKRNVLIPGFIALLLLVLLAASMRGLVFKQAVPFAIKQEQGTGGGPGALPQIPIVAVLLGLAALMISIYFLLPKEHRRRYLVGLLAVLVFGWLILYFLSQSTTYGNLFELMPTLAALPTPVVTDVPETPLPPVASTVYTPPVIPAWISFLITLAALILLAALAWWLILRRRTADVPYAEISEIAQEALDDLDAGKDWGDTVLNCYYRMTRAVKGQRGFERRGDVTPSEFVALLEKARLPGEPLRRLTTLFERVRYGAKQSTQKDMDEAVECLTEIVQASQEAVL